MEDNYKELDVMGLEVKLKSSLFGSQDPLVGTGQISNEMLKDCESFDMILEAMLLNARRSIIKVMKKSHIIDQSGKWIRK